MKTREEKKGYHFISITATEDARASVSRLPSSTISVLIRSKRSADIYLYLTVT